MWRINYPDNLTLCRRVEELDCILLPLCSTKSEISTFDFEGICVSFPRFLLWLLLVSLLRSFLWKVDGYVDILCGHYQFYKQIPAFCCWFTLKCSSFFAIFSILCIFISSFLFLVGSYILYLLWIRHLILRSDIFGFSPFELVYWKNSRLFWECWLYRILCGFNMFWLKFWISTSQYSDSVTLN